LPQYKVLRKTYRPISTNSNWISCNGHSWKEAENQGFPITFSLLNLLTLDNIASCNQTSASLSTTLLIACFRNQRYLCSRRIGLSSDSTHLVMSTWGSGNVHITLPLENHYNVRPTKLEIGNLVPLRQRHTLFRSQHN